MKGKSMIDNVPQAARQTVVVMLGATGGGIADAYLKPIVGKVIPAAAPTLVRRLVEAAPLAGIALAMMGAKNGDVKNAGIGVGTVALQNVLGAFLPMTQATTTTTTTGSGTSGLGNYYPRQVYLPQLPPAPPAPQLPAGGGLGYEKSVELYERRDYVPLVPA